MIYDFSQDPLMKGFNNLCHRVNSLIGEVHGEHMKFNLNPANPGSTFKSQIHDRRGNSKNIEVRINSVVPNDELFSLAQELVRPADEPFTARNIFEVDSSYHEGSQTIGYDVIDEQGEAKLVAVGRTATNISKADASIDRQLNAVGKLMSYVEVTRDDVQQIQLRNDRGMGPMVSLLQEKLRIARKHINRQEDSIIWVGGNVSGIQKTSIPGVFDYFSTTASEYEGATPSKGKEAAVSKNWSAATADEIIADIAAGVSYIMRNGAYAPNVLALPHSVLVNQLGLKRTSDTDSTPLIEWIKRSIQPVTGKDLKIVGTNALEKGTVSGTTRPNDQVTNTAFMLLDSNKFNQAIAVVEDITLLPSKEDEQQTIKQVTQMKTGGIIVKHPSSMYLGTGIA